SEAGAATLTQAVSLLAAATEGPTFHPPSIMDFFPEVIAFANTPFAFTRIHFAQLLATAALVLVFWLGTRRMRLVPGRFQSLVEMGFGFVRGNIAHDLLGRKDGDRFLPIL